MNEMSVLNTLARKQKAADANKDDGALMDQLIEAFTERDQQKALAARLIARNALLEEDTARQRERAETATTELSDWKAKCATLEERCANLSMPAPAPERPAVDYEAKCDSLLAKLADLESKHAACGPKADAQRRVEEVLRAQVADLKSQALAVPAVVETEREYEEPTGCQIDVIRGGDDRMRSLVVRYTKS